MELEEKIVCYTIGKETVNGILVYVDSHSYILHNDKNFPGCTKIAYDPWVKKYGKEYSYYNYDITMKNVKELSAPYELWD